MSRNKYRWKKFSRMLSIQRQKKLESKILRKRKCRKHPYVPLNIKINRVANYKGDRRDMELGFMFPGYKHIVAPKIFSLVKNEKEVLHFLRQLRTRLEQRKKTLVRLDYVEELPTDAILLLLSVMVKFRIENVPFNGTKPDSFEMQEKLQDSGFFQYLFAPHAVATSSKDYTFKNIKNHLYTHGQKTVASELADHLVKYASEVVWGEKRRCPGIQKSLVELMHNTYDHADVSKGEQHWWLSVEHDNLNKEVTFSFMDFGVGIFRSLENKTAKDPLYGAVEYIKSKFPWAVKQVDKLRLILEGKARLTQTNQYFRGKGLAKIYNHYTSHKIASLCILSNYASVNADFQDFHTLEEEFLGTFVSFKINSSTYSLPWQI